MKLKYIIFSISSIIIIMIVSACYNLKEVVNNPLITINSDRDTYKQGEPIIIEVTIENLSRDRIVLLVVPSFEISSEQFKYGIWSPVNFGNNNQNLKANEKDQLELLPKERRNFKYTLNNLRWDRRISSFWPSKELTNFMGRGVYTIIFTLQATIDNRPGTLTSNPVTIKVK